MSIEAPTREPDQALFEQALAHIARKDYLAARDSLTECLALAPKRADARFRLGATLYRLDQPEAAITQYDQALALDGSLVDAWYNRGLALQSLGYHKEALGSYKKALALAPGDGQVLNNVGNVLQALGDLNNAYIHYRKAFRADPTLWPALFNCGVVNRELGQPHKSVIFHDKLLKLQPNYPGNLGELVHSKMLCCDWDGLGRMIDQLQAAVRSGKDSADPFGYLAVAETAQDAAACSNVYARQFKAIERMPAPAFVKRQKIRLAYASGEFREQATSNLAVDLFESHDRDRFELTAIDHGRRDESDIRRRLEASFGEFFSTARMGDQRAAQGIRERGIDILVDLNGYFGTARPGILARKPAPIQVNYLGFPNTTGASHMDYILADPWVIPASDSHWYAEQVVHLPDCYQANDGKRALPGPPPTRAQAGLPEQGFVFCSFNNNYKLTPAMFDVWMRLLVQVEGSVLWLLAGNAAVADNLRRQAASRGVDPTRLVFASRLPQAEHMARHGLADLFLDTVPCNAHTTASDALWAGLPLITCLGQTFAARVATSLVMAMGLPELSTRTLVEYEMLALRLARQPAELAALRARLQAHRTTQALFDTQRLCRHIERAYETMVQRWAQGLAPQGFAVAPLPR